MTKIDINKSSRNHIDQPCLAELKLYILNNFLLINEQKFKKGFAINPANNFFSAITCTVFNKTFTKTKQMSNRQTWI